MKTVKSILLIALAVMMASCCACRKGKKVVDKPLTATKWELVELNGQQIKTNDNYYIMLSDTSNNFNGRGDCNSLMGNYTLDSEHFVPIRQVKINSSRRSVRSIIMIWMGTCCCCLTTIAS